MYQITVITLTLNSEAYLHQCLQSVNKSLLYLYQKLPLVRTQHLVVDGGSSDTTREICSKYPYLNFHLSPCKGLYKTLDYAVSISNSCYVTYVHSDDYVAPEFIASLYLSLSSDTTQIPACDVKFVDSASRHLWSRTQPPVNSFLQKYTNLVLHPNCIYYCEGEKLFPYHSTVEQAELDWKHINTLIESGYHFKRVTIPECVYYMRLHSSTVTARSIRGKSIDSDNSSVKTNPHLPLRLIAKLYLFLFESNKVMRILHYLRGTRHYQ